MDLVDRWEAADLLGVTYGAVGNWIFRGRQGWTAVPFPEPVAREGNRRFYRRQDVEEWALATARVPIAALDLSAVLDV
jgi:hypothetical protein